MPDLTIEVMQQCAKLEYEVFTVAGSHGNTYTVTFQTSERTGPLASCTCPAFQYGRGAECKHITQTAVHHCTWHELYGAAIEHNGTCPECGGPTTYVRVAV